MAVDNLDIIDIVSTAADGGSVLTITDHLEWGEGEHLAILQTKLNLYPRYVESGEILERFPDSRGKKITIELVMMNPPDATAIEFLKRAGAIIEGAGHGFACRQLPAV